MIEPTLLNAIRQGRDILCISHINPDGDAVGSLLGMGWILRRLGKQPTLALQDAVPSEHCVLPGAAQILSRPMPEFETAVRQHGFDLIICLDSSSPDRMGAAYAVPQHEQATLLIIDHHVTNTRFGDVNWVAPECAAVCQMLVYLADALDITLDGELAECLLTGLVTDTLCFRTSNTTPDVLGAGMRLMQGGADLSTITARTVNRRPFSLIKLWSKVLPAVQLEDGVIWTAITRRDMQEAGGGIEDVNLSSFLVTADEADISAVFTATDLEDGAPAVECSFRAKPGFDVSQLALALGGGGHPAASGCTLADDLPAVIAQVTPLMKAARRQSIQNQAQQETQNGANSDSARR